MKILLTNDDGIYSAGIYQLYLALREIGDVSVVAPIAEMSAVGHAITISDPLQVKEFKKYGEFFGVAVKGTPADCVKVAVTDILDEKPDIVVSGINHGANVASNVIYSGTVSAATEGAMMGIKSVAVSLATKGEEDFAPAAKYGAKFAKMLHDADLPADTILNVNVPPLPEKEIKGWKFAKQGRSRFFDTFARRVDPRGNTYYWLTGERLEIESTEECDDYVVGQGYVSVVPLKYDMTHYDTYNALLNTEGAK